MTFSWEPSLSIGVDKIDEQHQELFRRVSALLESVSGGNSEQEVFETLAFLGTYVSYHFEDEEALMRESGYPGLAHQAAEHARFQATFKRLCRTFSRSGADGHLVEEVRREVCQWLRDHLDQSDRQLGEWMAARRRASDAG